MSETLVAGRIPLDGPIPRPPLYSLVSVATEVTDDLRGGANIIPYPAAMPGAADPCADGSTRTKDDPEGLDLPEGFPKFTAYLGEICSSRGIGSWDEWRARANIALTARTSFALERQLVNATYATAPNLAGAGAAPNPSLPAGASAVPVLTALSWLEAAIAETGQEGVIHVPPPVATAVGAALHDDRGILRTASGTPVVVGAGYFFVDSDTLGDAAGGSSAAAGQSYVYATGRVLYQAGPLLNNPETLAEALDRETNDVVYRAERDLFVAWDGQLQAAVLADWSP